jgi:transcriptional regulator GlxA family with amidase domain
VAEIVNALSLRSTGAKRILSRMGRRVVIVVFEGFQSLDAFGPAEVFARAGDEVQLAALAAGPVRASNGVRIDVELALPHLRGQIDTLLVTGGPGTRDALRDGELLGAIARSARRARRVVSVCSGAFLLAEAGLLDGRRATTHWKWCDVLARQYPAVEVDGDSIFVRDGNVWTSAGVTAGIDLALALVDDDQGVAVAREVARDLVVYLQRPGGQQQFSVALATQPATRPALRDLQTWVREHLRDDCSVAALARQAAMSERTLARAFRAELGVSPADFVEQVRIEAGRQLLESSDLTVAAVARSCGFGTTETLHRAFLRRVNVTPAAYRERFRRPYRPDRPTHERAG